MTHIEKKFGAAEHIQRPAQCPRLSADGDKGAEQNQIEAQREQEERNAGRVFGDGEKSDPIRRWRGVDIAGARQAESDERYEAAEPDPTASPQHFRRIAPEPLAHREPECTHAHPWQRRIHRLPDASVSGDDGQQGERRKRIHLR